MARSNPSDPFVGPPADDLWSPDSRDLVAQLPSLVNRLAGDGVVIRRVMFNPADWNIGVPRRATVGGQVVKLGAFNYQQRQSVTVIDDSTRGRVTLLLGDDKPITGSST